MTSPPRMIRHDNPLGNPTLRKGFPDDLHFFIGDELDHFRLSAKEHGNRRNRPPL
jgi:hypothetical protein